LLDFFFELHSRPQLLLLHVPVSLLFRLALLVFNRLLHHRIPSLLLLPLLPDKISVFCLIPLKGRYLRLEFRHKRRFNVFLVLLRDLLCHPIIVVTYLLLFFSCLGRFVPFTSDLGITLPCLHNLAGTLTGFLNLFPCLRFLVFEKGNSVCKDLRILVRLTADLLGFDVSFALISERWTITFVRHFIITNQKIHALAYNLLNTYIASNLNFRRHVKLRSVG
jgi:hypothetical protein